MVAGNADSVHFWVVHACLVGVWKVPFERYLEVCVSAKYGVEVIVVNDEHWLVHRELRSRG